MSVFFDTNILLYSLLDDDLGKAEVAVGLIANGGIISVQVLNEMVSVLRGRKKWEWGKVTTALSATKVLLEVCDLSIESQTLAVAVSERYQIAIYDANIVSSAKLAGCETLWSEDMRHGQVIDGVRIVNPFADLLGG